MYFRISTESFSAKKRKKQLRVELQKIKFKPVVKPEEAKADHIPKLNLGALIVDSNMLPSIPLPKFDLVGQNTKSKFDLTPPKLSWSSTFSSTQQNNIITPSILNSTANSTDPASVKERWVASFTNVPATKVKVDVSVKPNGNNMVSQLGSTSMADPGRKSPVFMKGGLTATISKLQNNMNKIPGEMEPSTPNQDQNRSLSSNQLNSIMNVASQQSNLQYQTPKVVPQFQPPVQQHQYHPQHYQLHQEQNYQVQTHQVQNQHQVQQTHQLNQTQQPQMQQSNQYQQQTQANNAHLHQPQVYVQQQTQHVQHQNHQTYYMPTNVQTDPSVQNGYNITKPLPNVQHYRVESPPERLKTEDIPLPASVIQSIQSLNTKMTTSEATRNVILSSSGSVAIGNVVVAPRNVIPERPIICDLFVLHSHGPRWHPPYRIHRFLQSTPANNWNISSTASLEDACIYIRVEEITQSFKKTFKLPFKNILANKSKSTEAVWPPSNAQLARCADLSDWQLSMTLRLGDSIKATILDPWGKAYLLQLPVKP